jgi:thiamine transport system permease protein
MRSPGIWALRGHHLLLLLLILLFLGLFFYYPLITVLHGGIRGTEQRFSLQPLVSLLADGYYRRIILFTFTQALLSTVLAVLFGLPGAYLLARFRFPGKRLVRALTTIPFVLPSILVVLGFVLFFGNNGILNRALMSWLQLDEPPLRVLYSLKAILLAHAFYNFPICIRIVSGLWSRINPHLEEAARSLGARGWRLFRRVTLPQIMPGVLASAALIFIFCFMSFAVVLVLGGGPRYATLEVEVYRLAKVGLDLGAASRLAAIGSLLTLLFLYVYIKLQQRASFAEAAGAGWELRPLSAVFGKAGALTALAVLVYLVLMAVVVLAPMLSVVYFSFLRRFGWAGQTHLSLHWYRMLLGGSLSGVSYLRAIHNSLIYGALTVLCALPLGTAIAYLTGRKQFFGRHGLETLAMLPMGVSTIILGLGYLKLAPVFRLTGGRAGIVAAHTVIAYPFVIRAVSSMVRKISPSLPEAARSLGANPRRLFFKIELPLLKPGILAGAAFAFAISLGEINATLMLYKPSLISIPVAIYRLISSYNFFAACAMGSLLMLTSLLAFIVIDRIGEGVF